jgi:hypothetical protein
MSLASLYGGEVAIGMASEVLETMMVIPVSRTKPGSFTLTYPLPSRGRGKRTTHTIS